VEFCGYIEAETARAWLFRAHFWDEPTWLPKSQVTIRRDLDTDEVSVVLPHWLCVKNSFKEF